MCMEFKTSNSGELRAQHHKTLVISNLVAHMYYEHVDIIQVKSVVYSSL